jgi:Asp-tRNA(Asn)/Glu-tRNA(Gln) amidotransferase C subunit
MGFSRPVQSTGVPS